MSPPRSQANLSRLASLDELVAGAQAKQPEAVRAFVKAVGPTILSAIRRVVGSRHPDVEDIAQEAVMAILKALTNFRNECSVRHFVCRIATFQAISARRRAHYREVYTPATEAETMEAAPTDAASQEDVLELERKRFAVRRLLDDLPEAQAEAIALYFIMGFTAEEVAEATNTGVPTVKSRIRLAREALRSRIEGSAALQLMLNEGHT